MLTTGTITIELNSCWFSLCESSSIQESKNTLMFIMNFLLPIFNLYEANNLMPLETRKHNLNLETIYPKNITWTIALCSCSQSKLFLWGKKELIDIHCGASFLHSILVKSIIPCIWKEGNISLMEDNSIQKKGYDIHFGI